MKKKTERLLAAEMKEREAMLTHMAEKEQRARFFTTHSLIHSLTHSHSHSHSYSYSYTLTHSLTELTAVMVLLLPNTFSKIASNMESTFLTSR